MLALPATSNASTTVGETASPTATCTTGSEYVQTVSPITTSYAVPAPGGVITSMSMHRPSTTGNYDLKVYRHGSGSAYTVLGATGMQQVTSGSGLATFATRIPVEPGDLLGLALGAPTDLCGTSTSDFDTQSASGDQPPGDSANATMTTDSLALDVKAKLEPDADGDGFGDETQDRCVGLYGSDEGCPKADLSVSDHPSAARVEGGAYVSEILTVRDHGPDPVPDVVVDDVVGTDAPVIAADSTAGTCALGQTVTCSLGSLANGASDIVVVAGRTTSLGTLTSEASVSSQALTLAQSTVPGAGDPDPSNNSSTATTEIVTPPFEGVTVTPQRVLVGARGRAPIQATSERNATGNLVLRATVSRARGLRPRTILVGHASFAITAGEAATIRVHLSATSLRLLARSGRLNAVVTARASDAFGQKITTSAKVVLRRRRPSVRRRPFV